MSFFDRREQSEKSVKKNGLSPVCTIDGNISSRIPSHIMEEFSISLQLRKDISCFSDISFFIFSIPIRFLIPFHVRLLYGPGSNIITFELLNSSAVAEIVSAIVCSEQFGDIVLKTGRISGRPKVPTHSTLIPRLPSAFPVITILPPIFESFVCNSMPQLLLPRFIRNSPNWLLSLK